MPYSEIFYLPYIDDFTIKFFMLIFILIFAIAMVFWFAKGFAYIINEVFQLKTDNNNNHKSYDFFQD